MHLGIFTPTEASAVAVFYAPLVGRFLYRTLQFSMLPAILYRTAILTASILMIIAAREIFSFLLTIGQDSAGARRLDRGFQAGVRSRAAAGHQRCCSGRHLHRAAARGDLCPDPRAAALAAGIHPLHFAMVVIVNLTLGMITPPVGALLRDLDRVRRANGAHDAELMPMFGALLVVLLLLTLFPGISTWLGVFGYSK